MGCPLKYHQTFNTSKRTLRNKRLPNKRTSIVLLLSLYEKKTSHYYHMVTRQNIKTNFRDIKTRLLINVNGMPVEISRRTFKISKRKFQKRIPNKRTYIVLPLSADEKKTSHYTSWLLVKISRRTFKISRRAHLPR